MDHQEHTGLATVAEAMTFLSISRPTIYNLIRDGSLPSVTLGKSRRFPWRVLYEIAEHGIRKGQNATN
jgi:excisionase family DNA binding protein